MLGISQTEHNNGDENNPSKIYGVAVNVKREDLTSITVAILCRDKKYPQLEIYFKYRYINRSIAVLSNNESSFISRKNNIFSANQSTQNSTEDKAESVQFEHFCVMLHNDKQYKVSFCAVTFFSPLQKKLKLVFDINIFS